MNRKQSFRQALVLVCVFHFSFFIFSATAQVTIGGESAPAKGATLDLSPSSGYIGGLKLPNVYLDNNLTSIPTSFTESSDAVKSELTGTVVYNTNNTIGTGAFIWNGSKWERIGYAQKKLTTSDVSSINFITDANIVNVPVGWDTKTVATFSIPQSGFYAATLSFSVRVDKTVETTAVSPYSYAFHMSLQRDNVTYLNIQQYAYGNVNGIAVFGTQTCYFEAGEYTVCYRGSNALQIYSGTCTLMKLD
ncbi:hypothetical protein D0T49_11850 [Paludibacter sp. 221]|uniref:hypothetical protein n=1 Tax=Paludibacter sp. 221 TaxID=2302939 RepID=UPI0013D89F2B|nr:hypothetical protein [Paludibacter sp. 221]NDV47741.1 hypothetical protein [Paludibacter sp. 221]